MDDSHVSRVGDDYEGCGFEESDSNERRDRLSELPDSLIHSILSFLPMKDVVRTTLLSKRWNHLWATVPCLDFSDHTQKFRAFIKGAIAFWKGTKILKFKLVFNFYSCEASDLDSWLLFAIDKRVEELHLDLNYLLMMYMEKGYHPPPPLYSCPSIRKLTLVGCALNLGKNMQWNQLESLTIHDCETLTEDAMDNIFYNAPRLEELDLRFLGSRFNIQSSSLKKLKIERHPVYESEDEANYGSNDEANESVLRISAPNLESLEMLGVPCSRCFLCVPYLTNAILDFTPELYTLDALFLETLTHVFQSLNHVEDITLTHWCIEKKDTLVSFSNAKYLTLYPNAAEEILGVVGVFPQLMTLVVELSRSRLLMKCLHSSKFCQTVDHIQPSIFNLDSLEAGPSLLHLRAVKIMWYMHNSSIYGVIEIILKNARKLEKMAYRPASCVCCIPEDLSMVQGKLLSMPRASPTAQVFIKKMLMVGI